MAEGPGEGELILESRGALDERQLDALREVANIGTGHAATALSQMTDRRVMISVPRVQVAEIDALIPSRPELGERVVAILTHVLGGVKGVTALFMSEETALRISDTILRRSTSHTALDELAESALKETGNIVCGSFLGALSSLVRTTLLGSTPRLVVDDPSTVSRGMVVDRESERELAVWIETTFSFEGAEQVHTADFLLVPSGRGIETILAAMGVA